jgi:tRNA (cmo5U34)-methyltransferase
MGHRVRHHLRLDIEEYDRIIRQFIPGYETMLERAADAVAEVSPQLVLDLGAGTGALSEALLERDEIGTVELLDVDPEMMEKAQDRLKVFAERVRFTMRSYDEPFPACDAFAASLSLHHIPTLAAKTALFKRAFAALSPGGVLVNADSTMPTDSIEKQKLYRYWADHLVAAGITEDRAWQHFKEWEDEDTYLPLADELAALQQIGFTARRIWNDGPIGVVVARKPNCRLLRFGAVREFGSGAEQIQPFNGKTTLL